jgi:serine/threonine protein kinase
MGGATGMGEVNVATGVNVGDVLAGKFRVDKIIGLGGMGVVVGAYHLHLDQYVAIKFLLPEASTNHEAVVRFAQEARAAAKIKNEHVARVIDVGTLDNGGPYMVMEYLEGTDLARMLAEHGRPPVVEVVDYVLQACEALAEAHSLGIVHRDLKPSNLFLVRRSDGSPSVKILDFGISKVTGGGPQSDLSMTKTAVAMGSPLYMSPEQMESARDTDARTDIWAIGVILYELLSGKPPFGGVTLPEICIKIATHSPPSLRDARPGLPPILEAAVLRCLAKDRNERFGNVADLAFAIAEFGPTHAKSSAERARKILAAVGLASPEPWARSDGRGAQADRRGTTELVADWTLQSWNKTSPRVARKRTAAVVLAALAGAAAVTAVALRRGGAGSDGTAPSSSLAAPAQPPRETPPDEAPSHAPATSLAIPDPPPLVRPSSSALVVPNSPHAPNVDVGLPSRVTSNPARLAFPVVRRKPPVSVAAPAPSGASKPAPPKEDVYDERK